MDMRCRLRAVRWRLDPPLRGRAPRRGPGGGRGRRWLLTALVALALAAGIVGWLQHQLRPLVEAAARAQAANALTAVIDRAIEEAKEKGIHGKETTPFLLAKVKEITGGDSLDANIQLVFNNAKLAAQTAVAYCKL